jgi:hypothetical protein
MTFSLRLKNEKEKNGFYLARGILSPNLIRSCPVVTPNSGAVASISWMTLFWIIASAKSVRLSMQAIRTSFMPRALRSIQGQDHAEPAGYLFKN